MAEFIITKRTTESILDQTVERCVRTHVVSQHLGSFYRDMRGRVKVSVYAGFNYMLHIAFDLPEDQNKDVSCQLDESWATEVPDSTSLVSLTADYFHPASNYREEFTAEGETMDDALTAWHKKVNKRQISINYRGDITFPDITFYLYYRVNDGGWQPIINGAKEQTLPPVFLGSMPPRWRRAWDDFCGKYPKFLKGKERDEALHAIILPGCTGPLLEI